MAETFSAKSLKLFPNRWIVFCDLCGAIVWLYGAVKIFFFDIDRFLVDTFAPQLGWIVQFRFILVLAFLGIVGLVAGRQKLLGLVIYVIAFPIIFIAWKVSFVLIRAGSWTFGIAFVNWFLSLFTDLIYKAISVATYAASVAIIVTSQNDTILSIGCVGLVVSILATYIRTAINSFRAPRVLVVYRRVFSFISDIYVKHKVEEAGPPGTHLTAMPPEKIQTYASTLQTKVAANRAILFFAKKLERYQKSQIPVLSGIWIIFSLIVTTVFAFSFLYLGVHKIDPNSISSVGRVSTFSYFQISFDNMLFDSIGGIDLSSPISQAVSIFQRFLSITMLGMFIGILFTVRNRKYEEEIDDTISDIKRSGGSLETSIVSYYQYKNIDEAIADLNRINNSAAGFLARLTASLE